jgi:hypothetical protein
LQAWLEDLALVGHRAPAPSLPALQPTPAFPDLELYVRMCGRFFDEYKAKLVDSLAFFWPTAELAVVLDAEAEGDRCVVLGENGGRGACVCMLMCTYICAYVRTRSTHRRSDAHIECITCICSEHAPVGLHTCLYSPDHFSAG